MVCLLVGVMEIVLAEKELIMIISWRIPGVGIAGGVAVFVSYVCQIGGCLLPQRPVDAD